MIEYGTMMTIIAFMTIISYIIAIGVAIVAFWNYWKIRNRNLFVLAVAYTLLAATHIITPIAFILSFNYHHLGQGNVYSIIASINSGLLLTVFALLAYVYYTERRARGIKIDKFHWFIGCLVIAPLVVALIYFALATGFTFMVHMDNTAISYLIIPYLSGIPIIALQTHTIISLHSYYQNVKNRNTLIVMAGFIFLLLAYVASFLAPVLLQILRDNVDVVAAVQSHSYIVIEGMLGLSLTLAGYILFLVAMLRLKRS